MLRYFKLALALYLLIGLMYSLGFGYFLFTALQKAGTNFYNDDIDKVVWAKFNEGVLKICLSGKLASSGEKEFSFFIPLTKIKESSGGKNTNGWDRLEFGSKVFLSRQYIHKGCQFEQVSNERSINIQKVELKQNSSILPGADLEKLISLTSADLLVNEVSVVNEDLTINKNKTIVLTGSASVIGDPRYLYINVEAEKAKGSILWWFVIPLAAVADAITFPYQVYKWLVYAGSHETVNKSV